ncbi:hypothetical protein B4U79_10361 [Dinothrombium tinctorium]|uniref:Integrase zinc-binding domain-containing protein n=1 Tax=Dinothrombium tinctorium TaxID=1965070 RepID=A0A3S3P7T9_9ACAR|nr:hypothetical protein B4U79_10361 [Dinothrombium tinctorium]
MTHLQSFEFDIEYRSGKTHKDVDCLSRYPTSFTEEEEILDSSSIPLMLIQNLPALQKSDSFFKTIIDDIHEKGSTTDYNLVNDTLYRVEVDGGKETLLLCIPEAMISDILYAYHESPLSGHLGQAKTGKVKRKILLATYGRRY